jgi:hypothetical protein
LAVGAILKNFNALSLSFPAFLEVRAVKKITELAVLQKKETILSRIVFWPTNHRIDTIQNYTEVLLLGFSYDFGVVHKFRSPKSRNKMQKFAVFFR